MHHSKLLIVLLAVCAVLGTVSVSQAAKHCVNPNDAACFDTIQEGVDAASVGDTVVIHPLGSKEGYDEQVIVNTANLTIKGKNPKPNKCSKVYVDGCNALDCYHTPFTVDAPNVTFSQLFIRHADPGIMLNSGADGAVIDHVCFIDNHNAIRSLSIQDGTDNVTVTNSSFFGGQNEAIGLKGNNIVIKNNTFPVTDNGIDIVGHSALVKKNNLKNCNDESIEVRGNNAQIISNVVLGCDDGINLDGNNPTVQYNKVEFSGDDNFQIFCCSYDVDALECGDPDTCTGGVISFNESSYNVDDDELLRVTGDNLTITDNTLSFASQDGLEYTGSNGQIRRNKITKVGTESKNVEHGMYINGSDNKIVDNVVKGNSFAGIWNQIGNRNEYRNNVVKSNGRSGIHVKEGDATVVDGNEVTGNHGEGISNGVAATNTVITDNKVKKNKTDICNDGNIATFTGNIFDTGGDTTGCVVVP